MTEVWQLACLANDWESHHVSSNLGVCHSGRGTLRGYMPLSFCSTTRPVSSKIAGGIKARLT